MIDPGSVMILKTKFFLNLGFNWETLLHFFFELTEDLLCKPPAEAQGAMGNTAQHIFPALSE